MIFFARRGKKVSNSRKYATKGEIELSAFNAELIDEGGGWYPPETDEALSGAVGDRYIKSAWKRRKKKCSNEAGHFHFFTNSHKDVGSYTGILITSWT